MHGETVKFSSKVLNFQRNLVPSSSGQKIGR